jgi:hypothetical protein
LYDKLNVIPFDKLASFFNKNLQADKKAQASHTLEKSTSSGK